MTVTTQSRPKFTAALCTLALNWTAAAAWCAPPESPACCTVPSAVRQPVPAVRQVSAVVPQPGGPVPAAPPTRPPIRLRPSPTAVPETLGPESLGPAVPATTDIMMQPSLLTPEFAPIDLPSAVRLAGLRNPDLFLARQRVVEAAALRQMAAAQLLPTLNAGMNFDAHSGPLQQSNGNILRVSRSALYAGAGANAIAAGTVNIPGVVWNLNVSNTIFGMLVTRQIVREREFANASDE